MKISVRLIYNEWCITGKMS